MAMLTARFSCPRVTVSYDSLNPVMLISGSDWISQILLEMVAAVTRYDDEEAFASNPNAEAWS